MQVAMALEAPRPRTKRARPYQTDAHAAVNTTLAAGHNALVVLPTGTGKTFLFGEIAEEWLDRTQTRVLVLVERRTLVHQAAMALKERGLDVGVEQAGRRHSGQGIIVGSVQTLQGPRLTKMLPAGDVGLVIIDEAHHAAAPRYQAIIQHLACPVVGVTATPVENIAATFPVVAYSMTSPEAITGGWLVPFDAQRLTIPSLDLKGLKKKRGEFDLAELDKRIMAAVTADDGHSIVDNVLAHTAKRQTIVFLPSVQAARFMTAELQRRGRAAELIVGDVGDEDRERAFTDFRAHRLQYLITCDALTEGFDAPEASCVVLSRPTMSRVKLTQMIGRGLRTLPTTISGLEDATDAERRAAIKASDKPDCLILDIAGVDSPFEAMDALDIIAAGLQADELRAAKERYAAGSSAADAISEGIALAEERRREAERITQAEIARRLAAKAKEPPPEKPSKPKAKPHLEPLDWLGTFTNGNGHTRTAAVVDICPWAPPQADPWAWKNSKPCSEKQAKALEALGWPPDIAARIPASYATSYLISGTHRQKHGLCTYKQAALLIRRGHLLPHEVRGMTKADASKRISEILAR